MPISSDADRVATGAVVTGMVVNPMPLLFQEGAFDKPLLLLGFVLWQASPWLIMALSLRLVRHSSQRRGIHTLVSIALLIISMIVYSATVVGSRESMSWALFLGVPIVGIPIATIVLVACWLRWRDDRAESNVA